MVGQRSGLRNGGVGLLHVRTCMHAYMHEILVPDSGIHCKHQVAFGWARKRGGCACASVRRAQEDAGTRAASCRWTRVTHTRTGASHQRKIVRDGCIVITGLLLKGAQPPRFKNSSQSALGSINTPRWRERRYAMCGRLSSESFAFNC